MTNVLRSSAGRSGRVNRVLHPLWLFCPLCSKLDQAALYGIDQRPSLVLCGPDPKYVFAESPKSLEPKQKRLRPMTSWRDWQNICATTASVSLLKVAVAWMRSPFWPFGGAACSTALAGACTSTVSTLLAGGAGTIASGRASTFVS